jgi:undecaprenyl-diphosphatase
MSLIELLKYIFIGVVQGFTEILPISSSGHVELLHTLFKLETDTGYFLSSLLNLGSFIAIFIFFWKFEKVLICDIFKYIFKKDRSKDVVSNFRHGIAMVIATIPISIVGLAYSDVIISLFDGYLMIIVGVGFFASATLLFLTKNIVNKYVTTKMSFKDGLIIGLLQPIAFIPGFSRLALTTCSGLLRKKSMETSLRFSILLYLPISFGQFLFGLNRIITNPDYLISFDSPLAVNYIYYFCAFIASVGITFLALKNIFIWVRKGRFGFFALYNAIIGLIAFAYGLYMN